MRWPIQNWQSLARFTDAELGCIDIAAMNLACARGLPSANRIDLTLASSKLDTWAESCRQFIDKNLRRFHAGRTDGCENEAQYRILAMVTHLRLNLGIRYNPDRIDGTVGLQPEDSFLHGITDGNGGTCGTLPIFYAAIGRRLGYPIKLALAKHHFYCIWDGGPGGERFNIEGSAPGVDFHPDEYYRRGRYTASNEEIQEGGLLHALSPRQELAAFLRQRAGCWVDLDNYLEASEALAWAQELDPDRPIHLKLLGQCLSVWEKQLRGRLAELRFPDLDIRMPARQFLKSPTSWEELTIRYRVVQDMLDDSELEAHWWKPQREGHPPRKDFPGAMQVEFQWPALPDLPS